MNQLEFVIVRFGFMITTALFVIHCSGAGIFWRPTDYGQTWTITIGKWH